LSKTKLSLENRRANPRLITRIYSKKECKKKKGMICTPSS
jgi:hypothetical protein